MPREKFQKFIYNNQAYLANVLDNAIFFEIIIQYEVESERKDVFKYIKYEGNVVNDLVCGSSLEYTNIALSDFNNYQQFNNTIEKLPTITIKELSHRLPISVHGSYDEPF